MQYSCSSKPQIIPTEVTSIISPFLSNSSAESLGEDIIYPLFLTNTIRIYLFLVKMAMMKRRDFIIILIKYLIVFMEEASHKRCMLGWKDD